MIREFLVWAIGFVAGGIVTYQHFKANELERFIDNYNKSIEPVCTTRCKTTKCLKARPKEN